MGLFNELFFSKIVCFSHENYCIWIFYFCFLLCIIFCILAIYFFYFLCSFWVRKNRFFVRSKQKIWKSWKLVQKQLLSHVKLDSFHLVFISTLKRNFNILIIQLINIRILRLCATIYDMPFLFIFLLPFALFSVFLKFRLLIFFFFYYSNDIIFMCVFNVTQGCCWCDVLCRLWFWLFVFIIFQFDFATKKEKKISKQTNKLVASHFDWDTKIDLNN